MPKIRDYSKKGFKNPFFQRKKKKKKSRLFFLILIIILSGGLYFLNQSTYLQIKNIEISENFLISESEIKNIIDNQLAKKRLLILSQKNILFFNKFQAKKSIKKNYYLKNLKIKKIFPDTLKIIIEEKKSLVIWITDDRNYYLGSEGMVISEVKPQEEIIKKEGETQIIKPLVNLINSDLPIIYDLSNQKINIGEKTASQKLMDFIINLNKLFKENINAEISFYQIDSPQSREVRLKTVEGWQVYFKITDDLNEIATQVERLRLTLKEKISDQKNLEYIDLRFGERVYYK